MTTGTEGAQAPAEAQVTPDAIDKIISEASTEAPKTETADTETVEGEPKDDLWPKKAVNALAKAKATATRERVVRQQLERELEQYRRQTTAKPDAKTAASAGMPKRDDFVGKTEFEYMQAVNDWQVKSLVEQGLAERDKKSSQETNFAKQREWEIERDAAFDDNVEKATETFKDFKETMAAVKGKNLAPHVVNAFREADDPALALYALVKDGTLDSLNDMSPMKAAAAIARAEDKANAQVAKPKPLTNAPSPMTPNKGTATGSKRLDDASPDELRKWMREP